MNITAINPWPWSLHFGFNQAVLSHGHERTLYCSGQTALDKDGKLQHAGSMEGQVALAMDNLESVLNKADMTLANVVSLKVYTTDMDSYLSAYEVLASRLAAWSAAPAQTLIAVHRLFLPGLLFEVEATAIA